MFSNGETFGLVGVNCVVCKRLRGLKVSGKGELCLLMTGFQRFVFQSRSFCNTKSAGGLDLGVCDTRYLLLLEDNSKGFCSKQIKFHIVCILLLLR